MSQRPRQPYSHTPYTPCNLSHTGKDAHPHTERGYGLASFFHYCNMWERRGLYIYISVLKYCIIIAGFWSAGVDSKVNQYHPQ